jgi:hypothetical protein
MIFRTIELSALDFPSGPMALISVTVRVFPELN